MLMGPSSFQGQEGARPPLHLDHLVPGDLPWSCPSLALCPLTSTSEAGPTGMPGPPKGLTPSRGPPRPHLEALSPSSVSPVCAFAPLGRSHRPGPGSQWSGLEALPGSGQETLPLSQSCHKKINTSDTVLGQSSLVRCPGLIKEQKRKL